MANLSHINIDNVDIGPDSGEGFSLIPEGKYMAKVTDSKLIPTRAGNGHILELTWQIQSGPHERRLIWDKITLIHTSQQAQEIGRKQWKKALRAAGIDHSPQDSSEIHNKLVRRLRLSQHRTALRHQTQSRPITLRLGRPTFRRQQRKRLKKRLPVNRKRRHLGAAIRARVLYHFKN